MSSSLPPSCSSTKRGINGTCTPTYRKNRNVASATMMNGPFTRRWVAPVETVPSGIRSVCP